METTIETALRLCKDKSLISKFSRPMSHRARKLLTRMFQWSMATSHNIDKSKLYSEFATLYTPILYEDACHKFNLDTYPGKQLPGMNAAAASKYQVVLDNLLLKNLKDKAWLETSNIKLNPYKVALLTSPDAEEIYYWLTTRWLLIDFADSELNKLAEMANADYGLQAVQNTAATIVDHDKKNVSYLYAILRDTVLRNKAVSANLAAVEDEQKLNLKKSLEFYNTPKTPFVTDLDFINKLDREYTYIEELSKKSDDE